MPQATSEVLKKCNFSLPKSSRLRLAYQYNLVRQARIAAHSSFFTLSILSKPDSITQCGIIVSRRVGPATIRNLVKRRLRDLYRHHHSTIVSHLWLVLIARPAAATASYDQLQREWLRLGKRLAIFQAPSGDERHPSNGTATTEV